MTRLFMRYGVVLLVTANLLLFLDGALRHYPTVDEARLVPAGLVHWRTGEFDAADDVPPLARMISALPILAATPILGPCDDFEGQKYWTEAVGPDRASRDASKFVYHNRNQFMTLFRLARAPNFLWWVAGAWVIYRWARELHGAQAGWFALVLWSFGPNIVAREQTATPDLPLAVAALAATCAYRAWLREPSRTGAALAGALLGMALLTDYAALALLPAWAAIGAAYRFLQDRDGPRPPLRSWLGQIVLASVLCIWIMNSGYLFSRLGTSTRRLDAAGMGNGAQRLAAIFPADYRAGLAGKWRDSGRDAVEASIALRPTVRGAFSWAAMAAKVPLGTWALILGGAAASLRAGRADGWATWLIPSTMLVLASSPLGPILPVPSVLLLAAPFAIIGASSLSTYLRSTSRKTGWLVSGMLAWCVVSGLAARPHFLHYLNEAAGGTRDVASLSRYISGGDCGQDVAALKAWLEKRPEFRPVGLALRQVVDPLAVGIEYTVAPALSPRGSADPRTAPWCSPRGGPYPGRYAIDAYSLATPQYAYFRDFRPLDRIGASIFVYDVSREDADAARRRRGLPPVEDEPAIAASSLQGGFVRRRYRDGSGIEFNYAVSPPSGYPGTRPWPLILFLHGYDEREGGPRGDLFLDVTFPAAVNKRRDNRPFLAVVPQGKSGGWSPGGADAEMVLGVLDEVRRDYNVDPRRIYLTGVSSGGSGVWALAAAHPNLWAAIVPISAVKCDPSVAQKIAHVPCWCFHNLYDFKYSTAQPRAMITALRKSGASPRYTEYFALTSDMDRSSGLGSHDAWSKAYMFDELYAWLSRQAR